MSGSFRLPSSAKTNFVSITWKIPGWKYADADKLQIVANLLDERLSRDSFSSIVKAGSSDLFNLYEWAGQFGVYASFSSLTDSIKIQKHLMEVVNAIIEKRISESELQLAEQRLLSNVTEMIGKLGFIGSRAELIGEGFLYANDPGFYILRLKRQQNLNANDIQMIARKWLKTKGARLLLISQK